MFDGILCVIELLSFLILGIQCGGVTIAVLMLGGLTYITNLTPKLNNLMTTTEARFIFAVGTIGILITYLFYFNKMNTQIFKQIKELECEKE